jgi:dienelactone hydrolase
MRNILKLLILLSISTTWATDLTVFDYQNSPHNIELHVKKEKRNKTIYNGSLKVKDPINGSDLEIPFEYYQVKGSKKRPLVFVYPSVADEIPPIVERLIATKLSNRGYHAVITNLVEDIADTKRPVEKIDDFLIRSTIAFRHVLDKMILKDEVDSDKLYAIGTSLGGIRASVSLSAEPRLKKAFIYVAAGNLPEVLVNSKVGIIEKYKAAKMQELNLNSSEELLNILRDEIKVDPLNYASARDPQDVFLMLASKDVKVPYKNQLELLEAHGNPDHEIKNGDHRVVGSNFLFNMKRVIRFFEAN